MDKRVLQELIDAKKLELESHKADKETMKKFQKNIDQIQQQIKKGNQHNLASKLSSFRDMDDKNERLERRIQKESRREDRSRRDDKDRKRSRRSRSSSRYF